jgi:hypothetical protein
MSYNPRWERVSSDVALKSRRSKNREEFESTLNRFRTYCPGLVPPLLDSDRALRAPDSEKGEDLPSELLFENEREFERPEVSHRTRVPAWPARLGALPHLLLYAPVKKHKNCGHRM